MKSKILFALSGSISCFKACQVISDLVKANFDVQIMATSSALKFVGPATLEGLTGKSVATDIFEAGKMMDHIHLAKWADAFIICPASASLISRLAQGDASDLVSAVALAFDSKKKPLQIFPAMNTNMWSHPATKRNVKILQEFGYQVRNPDEGWLACGDVGEGRLPESNIIYEEVLSLLGPPRNLEVNA